MEEFSQLHLLKSFFSQSGKTEYSLSKHQKTNDLVVWQSCLKAGRIEDLDAYCKWPFSTWHSLE